MVVLVNTAKLNSYCDIAKTARHSPAEPPNATGSIIYPPIGKRAHSERHALTRETTIALDFATTPIF